MKERLLLLSLFLLSVCTLSAQGNRLVDSTGNFKYQYNRTVITDVNNSKQAIVSFVFINGNEQTAISYRQETLNSNLTWLTTNKGSIHKEKLVEVITANLAPKETLVWKFTFKNKSQRKDGRTTLERAALLILNSGFQADKITFDAKLSNKIK